MHIRELEQLISTTLKSDTIRDYVPNGLQIEGKEEVNKIVTGVTASLDFIDAAIEAEADAILVHHGYFWKNEAPQLTGMKYQRIKRLMDHNINLLAYHLPLDVDPQFGNNVQLAKKWGIENVAPLNEDDPLKLVLKGVFNQPMSGDDLAQLIEDRLKRKPLHCGDNAPATIKHIAWCSGAAQDALEEAANAGMDAFITGEVSERTIHIAREMGIHFYAAGHHATERCGVRALGEWLAEQYALDVQFIDIDNPV